MADPKSESRATAARNAELMINRLSDYLSIRFDLAVRINPQLKVIKQDLMFHEIANVRRCLNGEKIYGPTKMHVTDVFMADDEKKRRGLMSAMDQTSIQVELVSHCQDSKVEATRGQIKIHDLKTFYAAIDPRLTELMDLVETWIWWDVLDSAEIVRFEQKIGIIQMIRQGRMTDEGRKRYASLISPASEDDTHKAHSAITDDDVVRYEFKQLMMIRDHWQYRRGDERGYMYVLKRDELAARPMGEVVHRIAEHARQYETVEGLDELDEEIRRRWAEDMRLPQEKVTQKGILEYQQGLLVAAQREMISAVDRESQLGPPYNYKERQLEQIDKILADLAHQIRGVLQAGQPSAPAPATPAPAAH